MKSLIRCWPWLLFLPSLLATAAQLPPPQRPFGKVVILANERVLEGDIELKEGLCRIRRQTGEVTLPAEQIKHLAGNWEEALAFMAQRANLRDPDELLRLARWCQLNGQYELALRQGKAALTLRPVHPPTQQLCHQLERQLVALRNPAPAPLPEPVVAEEEVPAVSVSAQALGQFTSKIQPILMNTCASCHASGRGGAFRLQRVVTSNHQRRSTQLNLAAALRQINPEQPGNSPLLLKAGSVHGSSATAPLRAPQSPPYRLLEEWVRDVAARVPARPEPPAPVVLAPPAPRTEGTFSSQPGSAPPATPPSYPPPAITQPAPAAPASPIVLTTAPVPPAPANTPPTPTPVAPPASMPPRPLTSAVVSTPSPVVEPPAQYAPGDEFDPNEFNRRNHPQR